MRKRTLIFASQYNCLNLHFFSVASLFLFFLYSIFTPNKSRTTLKKYTFKYTNTLQSELIPKIEYNASFVYSQPFLEFIICLLKLSTISPFWFRQTKNFNDKRWKCYKKLYHSPQIVVQFLRANVDIHIITHNLQYPPLMWHQAINRKLITTYKFLGRNGKIH